jgi:hypothetical protein
MSRFVVVAVVAIAVVVVVLTTFTFLCLFIITAAFSNFSVCFISFTFFADRNTRRKSDQEVKTIYQSLKKFESETFVKSQFSGK